ncbi:cardiolipin synthase [Geoalkalibacter halelectricus]|uniref:Cardiolipin synthase n=1 Tax=Geoalkalibacter halelectricus TaxID=2847045 RepID=A0ABY5ZRC6_9BACT|nr:cardiolipin synthase [Geoalkalibacter halelectricus]MDO3378441.1 cardiolipin synthase [Geoalkalibacter halelectricus]UWZ80239.1 cardiolipin synthase [Geoalkalibacter halelectricus]
MLNTLLWFAITAFGVFSAGHALLNKLDPRAALGWIVACLALPLVGPLFYWFFGVNRIRIRARDWQSRGQGIPWCEPEVCSWSADFSAGLPFRQENFSALLSLSDHVTRRPLIPGNRLDVLHNGEQAYPAMLEAIRGARESIHLATYIFESNQTGRDFIDSLCQAAERGVEVRVLIDALGEFYSYPPARRLLRGTKVRVARFLPPSLSGRGIYFNLRNHRKLLIVDDRIGFTGGMNIGDRHLAARKENTHRVIDIHFRVQGPVVAHLQEAFMEDWAFCTRERLSMKSLPQPLEDGDAFCRGISSGPNEDYEMLHWIIVGALNSARKRLCIMTPYFIPNRALISAINAAGLRGVRVDILLPSKNNLPFVAWASEAYFWELVRYGINIHLMPPPFVHSKLLLVDDEYALVGSANVDPRSIRLNFEFNLEVYSRSLVAGLTTHCDEVIRRSHRVSVAEVDGRSLPRRLATGFFKLFSPYL